MKVTSLRPIYSQKGLFRVKYRPYTALKDLFSPKPAVGWFSTRTWP